MRNTSMMRNDTPDSHQVKSLERTFNRQFKNLFNRDRLHKDKDADMPKTEKCKNLTKDTQDEPQTQEVKNVQKNEKSNNTIYAKILNLNANRRSADKLKNESNYDNVDIKTSIHKAKLDFMNSEIVCPKLNVDNVIKFLDMPVLSPPNISFDMKTCENGDSRITGGGKLTSDKSKSTEQGLIKDSLEKSSRSPVTKKNSCNASSSAVTFKTKVLSRKPVYSTKSSANSTSVAILTQKFNDIIKENKENASEGVAESAKVKKSNSIIKKADVDKYWSLKCSNRGHMQKSETMSSPSSLKKVSRVKSDPKRKTLVKKKVSDQHATASDSGAMSSGLSDKSDIEISDFKLSKNIVTRRPSYKTSPTRHIGVVRAAIQKFEIDRRLSDDVSASNTKPNIPERRFNVYRTKNIVVKDGKAKIKSIKHNSFERKEIGTKSLVVNTIKKINESCNQISDKCKLKPQDVSIEQLTKNVNLPNIKETINPPRVEENITDEPPKVAISKTLKKEFHYDKIPVRKLLNDVKLKLLSNEISFKEEKLTNIEDVPKKETQIDVSAKFVPNNSFLWRSTSKSEHLTAQTTSPQEKAAAENIYDHPKSIPVIDLIECDSVLTESSDKTSIADSFVREINESLECINISQMRTPTASDREIFDEINASTEGVTVEAINILAISDTKNIRNEISLLYPDEDYEPMEPYRSKDDDSSTNSTVKSMLHSKANCPLPELPKDERKFSDDDSSSVHSYDYCHENKPKADRKDSDDGYEYCKSPKSSLSPDDASKSDYKNGYVISKSDSIASSMGYERISSIYEKIHHATTTSDNSRAREQQKDYYDCNCDENIYDTIKISDTASISNCYESISEASHYRGKSKGKRSTLKGAPGKHISFDTISNFSQSTVSSEQKTNSIYGQRSIAAGFDKTNLMAYGKCPSEITLSDKSEDWEDIDASDQDEIATKRIRGRLKGKHSPASWSRKVRHQWNESEKFSLNSDLFVSSPSVVYIAAAAHQVHQLPNLKRESPSKCDLRGLAVFRVSLLHDTAVEVQETTILVDSSDGEHLYETLSHQGKSHDAFDDDSDSFDDFDSDNSFEDIAKVKQTEDDIAHSQLPDPPTSNNIYAITRFASAAGKKMRQLTHTLTKSTRKKSVTDLSKLSIPDTKTLFGINKKRTTSNENIGSSSDSNNYQNIAASKNAESPRENNRVNTEKSLSPQISHQESLSSDIKKIDKDARRVYLSFKSKFRRSAFISPNPKLSPILTIPSSTFYVDEISKPEIRNENESSPEDTKRNSLTKNKNTDELRNQFLNDLIKSIPTINEGETKSVMNLARPTMRSPHIRPSIPPPLPPTDDLKSGKREKRQLSSSSWYAECSVFKSQDINDAVNEGGKDRSSCTTSWYAEIGLYQASNISTSSGASTISGSGTCSTTTAQSSSSTPIPPLGMFNQEPLYQFYNADKLESVCRDLGSDYDLNNYEDITNKESADDILKPIQRPSAMSFIRHKGPSRTLWCEIPEVTTSNIYETLDIKQKKLQEAKFEIITSEASYLNSLIVLENQYINNVVFQDDKIIKVADKHVLFGNIIPVKKCSERLMTDLETCWQDSILLDGLCKIIKHHCEKYFHIYITYCENQIYLVKTLKKLKSDLRFNDAIQKLQNQPACQSLALDSFLMLPMQRITRLPLLLDAVLKYSDEQTDEYKLCLETLTSINNIVSKCNEGARNVERIEEITVLSSQIEFPAHIKAFPILTTSEQNVKIPQRWLIRSGELIQLIWRSDEQSKLTFGRKISKTPLHLFLFTDLLIVAKKKSGEETFTVIDYCARSLIEMTVSDTMSQSPLKESSSKFVVLLTMLENHEKKTVEMLLSCATETDRQRWIEAFSPPPSNADEKIYEMWDCPQMTAVFAYNSMQPDELSIQPGDIVNVHKKMADGWYHGERIRDGELGWFPGNHCIEIASAHVRSKNLRQRQRLLALCGSYFNKEKKKNS